MGKVFVVTRGCYSDYRIEAIFTDPTLAQKYCEATNGRVRYSGEAKVEEWDLDPHADEIRNGFTPFFARITKAGDITDLEPNDCIDTSHGFDIDNSMFVTVMARDEDHARKIVSERHMMVLASGAWSDRRS